MEIEKEVTEFVKTINRGPLKEYFPKEKTEEKKIDWNKDDVYVEALYQGYLDACRTFKWSEKVKKNYPNEKAKRGYIEGKFKSDIAREIREYLNKPKAYSYSFDVFHEKVCKKLKECFPEKETNITYGQTQKIVNMAFKYLYCLFYKYGKLKEGQFADCHMPLDSFSLEWFKRCFKEEDFFDKDYFTKLPDKLFKKVDGEKLLLKAESIGSWSSIKTLSENETEEMIRYPYEFYRDVIKKYCEEYNEKEVKREIYPLQLDFIVWPKMQKIMAAEAFIKTMEESGDEKEYEKNKLEKYDIKDSLNQVLKDRLNRIRDLIGEK